MKVLRIKPDWLYHFLKQILSFLWLSEGYLVILFILSNYQNYTDKTQLFLIKIQQLFLVGISILTITLTVLSIYRKGKRGKDLFLFILSLLSGVIFYLLIGSLLAITKPY